MRVTQRPNGLYVVERTAAERDAVFRPSPARVRDLLIPRTDECVTCGTTFVVIPRHPMVENDQWCDGCLNVRQERLVLGLFRWQLNRLERGARAEEV